MPKSNIEAWRKKFSENVQRDRKHYLKLQFAEWRIAIFWECSVREPCRFEHSMSKFDNWVLSGDAYFESF
jgi:DNA mismatch endonuclease (patch repair protein)